jgi:hypothetical protein
MSDILAVIWLFTKIALMLTGGATWLFFFLLWIAARRINRAVHRTLSAVTPKRKFITGGNKDD